LDIPDPESDIEKDLAAVTAALEQRMSLIERLDAARPSNLDENGDLDLEDASNNTPVSRIENIAISQQLIHEIQSATLDKDKLDEDPLHRLQNPDTELVDISNPDIRLSLDLLMACSNASEATYNGVRKAIILRFPDINILSYYLAKKRVSEISGVESVFDDMCINSCMAFVGPWAGLQECPECSEPRYDIEQFAKTGSGSPVKKSAPFPLDHNFSLFGGLLQLPLRYVTVTKS
jgi:hypothetical protein